MKFFYVLIFLTLAFLSCQKNDEIDVDDSNFLLGKWSEAVYSGDSIEFARVKNLPDEKYGIAFEENGVFKLRSSGFCGTPPLFFDTSEGKWESENLILKIKMVDFPRDIYWRVLSLTEKKLIVKRELTEQEKDHQELMKLFSEIETLASSVICDNPVDWSFVHYGYKACGGPQGYIAYSNKINTKEFLEKVDSYTKKEKEFNEKWGIFSTCDIASKPKYISCENNKAVLKY